MSWNAHLVAVAGRDLLRSYLNGYLGVIERRHSLETHLPVPPAGSIIAAAQEDTGTPALGNTRVFVICPGLASDPEENEIGGYRAPYALMVGIEIQSRKNRDAVDSQLGYYQEAIRECVIREGYKVFGNVVIDWTDENTDVGDAGMALTSGSGITVFAVFLDDVVEDSASLFPDGPPDDPYEPLPGDPVIETTTFEVFNTPIDESL
jgi:hypothetical protein